MGTKFFKYLSICMKGCSFFTIWCMVCSCLFGSSSIIIPSKGACVVCFIVSLLIVRVIG